MDPLTFIVTGIGICVVADRIHNLLVKDKIEFTDYKLNATITPITNSR